MTEKAPLLPSGYRLIRYHRLGSTNDEARRLARDGATAGTLVWAATQTAGHGRFGRNWVSPPGNLYLSLIKRPMREAGVAAQLGFVAALGLGDALDALIGSTLRLSFKWPNDVLAGGRKLAGILLESETSSDKLLDFLVLGVGVNIASAPDRTDYPATSLAAEGVAELAPIALLEAFVWHFDEWYRFWAEQGFAPVRAAWLRRARGVGEAIRVRLDRTNLEGRFLDLDENGALLLEQPGGARRIAAGEVFPVAG